MLKVAKKTDRSVLQETIDLLDKKYSYTEKHEDGKLVLLHKRIKLVQITDTKEDKEKYFQLMDVYIKHVIDNYYPNVLPKGIEDCFAIEISTDSGKLPMFFVYNKNNELLGMAGFRGLEFKRYRNKQVPMHELSIRMNKTIAGNISYGYGTLAGIICTLMAFKKGQDIFAKTYPPVSRDWAFHFFDFLNCYYIGRKLDKFQFLDKDVFLDIFANLKIDMPATNH